jgi:hypothetical protein
LRRDIALAMAAQHDQIDLEFVNKLEYSSMAWPSRVTASPRDPPEFFSNKSNSLDEHSMRSV